MNIKNRIRKMEVENKRAFENWLSTVPDEELERIVRERGGGQYAEWLRTLTDSELETLRYGKPGASALKRRFNEYQKQAQKN